MLTIVNLSLAPWHCELPNVANAISEFLVDWFHLSLTHLVTNLHNHPGTLPLIQSLLASPISRVRVNVRQEIHAAMTEACRLHHSHVFRLLYEHLEKLRMGSTLQTHPFLSAVRYANLEMVQFIYDRSSEFKQPPGEEVATSSSAKTKGRSMDVAGEALKLAASNGHLTLVKFLCDHNQVLCAHEAAKEAAANGHVEIVIYFAQHKLIKCIPCMQDCALHDGQLEVVSALGSMKNPDSEAVHQQCDGPHAVDQVTLDPRHVNLLLRRSAEKGNMEGFKRILQWFPPQEASKPLPIEEDVMVYAARGGNLEVVQFLYSQGVKSQASLAIDAASAKGHVHVVEFLVSKGHVPMSITPKFLHLETTRVFPNMLRGFADYSKNSAIEEAIVRGHNEVVKCLFTKCGCQSQLQFSNLVMWAAKAGNLDVLKYFSQFPRYSKVPKDQLFKAAVESDDVEVARFVYGQAGNQKGFRNTMSNDAIFDYLNGTNLEMLRFLIRCEGFLCPSRWFTSLLEVAAQHGDLDTICFMNAPYRRVCGFSSNLMDEAATFGRLSVVRFLHENREEGCTKKAMTEAARKGYLHVVQFLHENRSENCLRDAVRAAASEGHLDIVKYLLTTKGDEPRSVHNLASEEHHLADEHYHLDTSVFHEQCALLSACSGGHKEIVQWLMETDRAENYEEALELVRNTLPPPPVEEASADDKQRETLEEIAQLLEQHLRDKAAGDAKRQRTN